MRFLRFTVPCAAATALLLTAAPVAHAQQSLLLNGNFESGSLANWTVARSLQPASENPSGTNDTSQDNWFADAPGTDTPATVPHTDYPSGVTFPTAQNTNPGGGGGTYAVTTSDNPSALALYQAFTLPALIAPTDRIFIAFDLFVNDQSGFAGTLRDASDSLDFRGGAAAGQPYNDNQHARVDLLAGTTTDFFSASSATVVLNLYDGADPSTDPATSPNPYTRYRFDVTGQVTQGMTYYLRFAEVSNLSAISVGVDNVSVVAVPEPGSVGLLLAPIAAVGLGSLVRRRRNRPAVSA